MIQFYLSVLLIVIIGLVLFTNKEHFQTCPDNSDINLNAQNHYDENSNWSGINLIFNNIDPAATAAPIYVLIQDKSDDKPIVVKLEKKDIYKNCTEDDTETKQCYKLNSDVHHIHPYRTYIISLNTTEPNNSDNLIVSNSIQITTSNPKLSEDNLNSKCGWNSPQKKLEDMFKKKEFEITL